MGPAIQNRKREELVKQILGIVGEIGAGKDTFCKIFAEVAMLSWLPVNIKMLRYSDIIAECLDVLHLEKSRENMQKFSPLIESGFGKGVLSRVMTERAALASADIVIIQGIRWMSDLAELRRAGGTLAYVTASMENRFYRIRKRTEKSDELGISWPEFKTREEAQTEIYIPAIADQADFRFENNGTPEEFRESISKFAAEYLPGWEPK